MARRFLVGKRRWLVLVLVGVMLGVALSQALRDTSPPEVFVVAPERIAAGEPFEVSLSANEPVVYRVSYGGTRLERVSQDLTLDLIGRVGDRMLRVTAVDGADNESAFSREITGVAAPELSLSAPAELVPGEPVTFVAEWTPDSAELASVSISKGGRPLSTHRRSGGVVALSSVPLGTEPGSVTLEAVLVDEFGREITAVRTLNVLPDPRPVQQLTIAPGVLASSTPENKALEARMLAEAIGGSTHTQARLWGAAFRMPIEGIGTSGFGTPRRYVVGGRVSYHQGADIGAPAGTPIHATNSGVVVVADFYPIKGGLVIIDHGANVFSLYFHQSEILVSPGDRVDRGQVIGEVGSTGLSTGPHLHWEMRLGDEPTNPMSWVGKVWP